MHFTRLQELWLRKKINIVSITHNGCYICQYFICLLFILEKDEENKD